MKVASVASLLALVLAMAPSSVLGANVRGASLFLGQAPRRLDVSGPEERECEFSEEIDEVEFECKVKSETEETEIKDEIEYTVATKGSRGLKVKVEYEQEIETDETETESETQFTIYFDRIIEYTKADSDASSDAYDWESDTIVQTIFLSQWSAFTPIEDDGVTATFSVTSGVAAFTFTVSRAAIGEALTANKMKIDVRIVDFPWDESGSYVALLTTVESKKEVDVEYEDDTESDKAEDVIISFEDATNTVGFVPFGEYTWAKEATVTSNATNATSTSAPPLGNTSQVVESTIEVVATSPTGLGNETVKPIAFSFVGSEASMASDIYWDPEAGIGYANSAATGFFSSLSIVVSGVLGAIWILA